MKTVNIPSTTTTNINVYRPMFHHSLDSKSVLCKCKDITDSRPLKRAYFMAMIDGVFCMRRACDKHTRDVFQSSLLTKVRLRVDITVQSLW